VDVPVSQRRQLLARLLAATSRWSPIDRLGHVRRVARLLERARGRKQP
jgi:hypothetical protein